MPATDICYHCGLDVPIDSQWQVRLLGADRPMCCPGCAAVAVTIRDSGMESYYRHRETGAPGSSPARELVPAALHELEAWNDLEAQRPYVRDSAEHKAVTVLIEGITCAACAWLIEHQLAQLPGLLECRLNLTSHRAELVWDPVQLDLATILRRIAEIGYRAEPYSPHLQEAVIDRENKQALARIGVAGLGTMQVMMFAVGLYAGDYQGITRDHELFLRGVSALICLPVYLYAGYPFLIGAWRNLKARRIGMDVPVAIALTGTYLSSLWATYSGGPEVYFDSVCMFIFFLLIGRYVEMRARHHALASAIRISRQGMVMAHWLQADGSTQLRAAEQLRPGDRVLVKAGEVIPGDGVVISGESAVNEAMLTGEDLPVSKSSGDSVTGGTINADQPLTVEIRRRTCDSTLQHLRRLLDRAQSEKPQIALLADRVARFFVARVLMIAPLVFAVWYYIDPSRAFWVTLSVLVVTCPCALSLATPTALTAATTRLARRGFLPTSPHFIESCQKVTDVVFDKTGTLTEGRFTLGRVVACQPGIDLLALAQALEAQSEHPIARAFTTADTNPPLVVTDFHSASNRGVEGRINGNYYRLGTPQFVVPNDHLTPPDEHGHWLLLSQNNIPIGWLQVLDRVRADAIDLIKALHERGLRTHILSGDASQQPAQVGNRLGIKAVVGAANPDQKLAYIRQLQTQGRHVLMIGDGLNDAPVLAGADVSIAMASGTELAKVAADAILLSPRLSGLVDVFDTVNKGWRVMRQNTIWAIAYNLSALPAAAFGLVPPWLAALGMSTSSLVVVGNAMRIQRRSKKTLPSSTASSIDVAPGAT